MNRKTVLPSAARRCGWVQKSRTSAMQVSMPSGSPGWMPLLLKNTQRPAAWMLARSSTPSALITPACSGTPLSDTPIRKKRSTWGKSVARRSYQAMHSAQVVVWLRLPRS
jgi:hypothetical protein